MGKPKVDWHCVLIRRGLKRQHFVKFKCPAAWLVLSGAGAGGFVCFLCLLRGFSTLVIAGAPWRLLTFLGPSSVCERDVRQEPQQVSQSSDEGRLSHVTGQHDCLTA